MRALLGITLLALATGCGRLGFEAHNGDAADADLTTPDAQVVELRGRHLYGWGGDTFGNLLGAGQQATPVDLTAIVDSSTANAGRASCAVNSTGTATCWGDAARGNGGPSADLTEPTQVGRFIDFKEIAIERLTGCGLRRNGEIWCWGNDTDLALGDGNAMVGQALPVQAGTRNDYIDLDMGGSPDSVCAVTSGGEVWCWGSDVFERQGNGAVNGNQGEPTPVAGLAGCTDVSVGWTSACAVCNADVWCWGDNANGQLGVGDTVPRDVPTQVVLDANANVVEVQVGEAFACAVVNAATNSLYCWGDNEHGQLGLGDRLDREEPVLVTALPTFARMAVGGYNTYAIDPAGNIWGWGAANEDALGGFNGATDQELPVQIFSSLGPVTHINAEAVFGAFIIVDHGP